MLRVAVSIRAGQKKMQEKLKRTMEEMMVKFGGHREGTKSDPEQTEPSPEMMQFVGKHQEVSTEAAVMPVGEPRKRRRNRNPDAERRQKPKERTRGYCGSQNRVTVADRKVSRRATVARRRRDIFAQERTRVKRGPLEQLVAARRGTTFRAKMAGETAKRWTFGRKRQSKQQGINGVKDLGGGRPRYLRKQDLRKLQLESTGNLNATLTTRWEIARRIVGSAVGLQAINIWTLWRGRPPLKRKKRTHTEQEPVM
jgi:lambda repressor-like predicted transcriptional regulator